MTTIEYLLKRINVLEQHTIKLTLMLVDEGSLKRSSCAAVTNKSKEQLAELNDEAKLSGILTEELFNT